MSASIDRERYIVGASRITLSLTLFATVVATLIAWTAPVQRPLDLIIPPVGFVIFLGLLVMLWRWPSRVRTIMRIMLLTALAALVAPAWVYTLQATFTPGLQLIDIYPPVGALLLVLMVMAMIYLPAREGVAVVALGWLSVALPVLVYLVAHPQQLQTPRGVDLLMTYGPAFVLLVALLPVQRGLTSRIQHLLSQQASMETKVNRDPLTGLYNRGFGEAVLDDLLARRVPAGVIMFDMDRFKAINDTHGHPVGDRVLQRVAERCQGLLRKDECLARWGGEEFLIVVPHVGIGAVRALAERLRNCIAELSIEPVAQVGASFGVTVIEEGEGVDQLLQRVDEALYRAKEQGGNVVAS